MWQAGTQARLKEISRPKERRIQGSHFPFEERLCHQGRGKVVRKRHQHYSTCEKGVLLNTLTNSSVDGIKFCWQNLVVFEKIRHQHGNHVKGGNAIRRMFSFVHFKWSLMLILCDCAVSICLNSVAKLVWEKALYKGRKWAKIFPYAVPY